MIDRPSVLLGLSVLLMIGWAVLITEITAERGLDRRTVTAGFEWKGDRGTLRVPHGELTYVSGNFLSLNCVIG